MSLCFSRGVEASTNLSLPSREGIFAFRSMLHIDSLISPTRSLLTKRARFLTRATQDVPHLFALWNMRPTLDMTKRYTPYLQKYSLSCEIAAVTMILKSLGISTDEDTIIRDLPAFPLSYSGGIWGDPDREFVGSITGSQMKRTGYGVYAAPLLRSIPREYHTEVFVLTGTLDKDREITAKKMQTYLENLDDGVHVLLWGDWCTDEAYDDGVLEKGTHKSILMLFPLSAKNSCPRSADERKFSWKTPLGKTIHAISGEHAFVLLGYMGTPERPTYIIVWDTDTGRHIYPYSEWMRKWSLLDYRALEIHPRG